MKQKLEALIDDIILLRDSRCNVGGEHYLIVDLMLQLAQELKRERDMRQDENARTKLAIRGLEPDLRGM